MSEGAGGQVVMPAERNVPAVASHDGVSPTHARGAGVIRVLLGLQAVIAAFYALRATTDVFGAGHEKFWSGGVYLAPLVIATITAGWRAALGRTDRVAWALITAGLALYAAGDTTWTFVVNPMADPPYPSLADAFYLAWYLPMFAGVGLLIGSGPARLGATTLLRSTVGALVVGSILAAVTLDPSVTSPEGGRAAVLTALAYPALDIVLLVVVTGALAAQQGAMSRQFLLLAAGLLLFTVADSVYLVQAATDGYVDGGPVDLGWVLGAICIAHAAWSVKQRRARDRRAGARFDAVSSGVFAVLLAGMLIYVALGDAPKAARVLVALGVVALLVEQAVSRREVRGLTDRQEQMSQGLHDNALQHVLAARQDLDLVAQGDAEALGYARGALESLVVELRRVMLALQPPQLAAGEVGEALTDAVADVVRRNDVAFDVDLPARVVGRHGDLVFGIARELVANAARHAHCTRVSARAIAVDDQIELTVSDDGVGLLPDRRRKAERAGHLGLVLVARRVESVDGVLTITADRGKGTTIVARLPRH